MRTILVTGGAGFIGSNFVSYMIKKYPKDKIIVLDALTYAGSVNSLPKGVDDEHFEFWYGNVKNGELVNTLVSKSDVVVHFAAESHVTRSIYDNLNFFETDVIGTQVVANSVLKYRDRVKLFVHISTSEVYGTALQSKMNEDHPLNPMSPYAAAKCGADRLVYSYHQTYKIPCVIVRPFNNFGPRQHLEKLIPRFVTSCILGEPLEVHGDGSASRDWLFVEDHCRALDQILALPPEKVIGKVLNLGVGESRSIMEIADIVRSIMGTPNAAVKAVENRPGQVDRHTCDASVARKLLDWEPKTSFEDGMKKVVDFYRENREWWAPQIWLRSTPVITTSGKKVQQ
jgi:dTDP-glucose 4,6-dehydratase